MHVPSDSAAVSSSAAASPQRGIDDTCAPAPTGGLGPDSGSSATPSTDRWVDWSGFRRRWFPTLLFTVLGFAALPIDVPLAAWLREDPLHGDVQKLLGISEAFAQGFGVAAILISIYLVAVSQRPRLTRVVTISIVTAIVPLILKASISRMRPYHAPNVTHYSETFLQWFPTEYPYTVHRSVPSGHTAAAVALALGLGWLFPRARYWFLLLAVLSACQRLDSGAHYLSDVCWGAAVGLFSCWLLLPRGPLDPTMIRLEQWWRRTFPEPPARGESS